MRPIAIILGSCAVLSAAHFSALSPEPFAGPRGHHAKLAPYQVPGRYLGVPRMRHGDPEFAGVSDAAGYIEAAEEIEATGEIPWKGLRHPLLNLLTAGLFAMLGKHFLIYYLVPLAFYLGSVWLVWRIARELFDEPAADLAALLSGLHITAMASSFSFISHAIAPFFNLAALLLFLRLLRKETGWIALFAVLGLGRLARLENATLTLLLPTLAWMLRRAGRDDASAPRLAFGREFWAGAAVWLLLTTPYHAVLWAKFGNPLYPFDLVSLLQGKPEDPKYTGHEGPFKMFALFFLTGSWMVPFLFWKGLRVALAGEARRKALAALAVLGFWFAGFSVQAVTDPGGIHILFGIFLAMIFAGAGLSALGRAWRISLVAWYVLFACAAQVLWIHRCQFLYGEGHFVIWALGLGGLKAWLTSLPIWKFGNP